MAAHHLAQGLASLGRNGDSMLMHVTPNEVAGLKNLAKSMGGEVTTNPHTGLPEASFFDFIGNMAPMFMGMLLGPEVLGASMLGEGGLGLTGSALTAAETALPIIGGAGTAAVMGQDPLMGALGGYGGAGVGGNFAKMGTPGGWAGQAIPQSVIPNAAGMASSGAADLAGGGFGQGMAATLAKAAPTATTAAEGFGNLASGIGKFASDPIGQFDAFKEAGGSGLKLGLPIGMAALDAMQPEPIDMSEEQARREAEKNKYRSTTGGLNLAASSGLNLGLPSLTLASGGAINADQSTISTGGIQDIYGSSDNTTANPPLSQDGYGIGRVDKLAQQGSLTKAGDMFYAQGGPVSFDNGGYLDGQGDGMSDSIPATIEGKQPARLADGEFVVPADVVSHIGNGSSKAGSKRLYAMLDKVRKARTGHTKQGKEINPNKYMPA